MKLDIPTPTLDTIEKAAEEARCIKAALQQKEEECVRRRKDVDEMSDVIGRLTEALAEATQMGYMTESAVASVEACINGYDGRPDITDQSGYRAKCRRIRESAPST